MWAIVAWLSKSFWCPFLAAAANFLVEVDPCKWAAALGSKGAQRVEEAKQILHPLSVLELRTVLCQAHVKSKQEAAAVKRDDLIRFAASAMAERTPTAFDGQIGVPGIVGLVAEVLRPCISISDLVSTLLWRVQRLFFLNGEQDLNSFLLVDLGLFKYPEYTVTRESPIFVSRDAFLAYEQALGFAQAMDMAIESDDTPRALLLLQIARAHLRQPLLLKPPPCLISPREAEMGNLALVPHSSSSPPSITPSEMTPSFYGASRAMSSCSSGKKTLHLSIKGTDCPSGASQEILDEVCREVGEATGGELPLALTGLRQYRRYFTAERVYTTMGTLGVSILERDRRYAEAVEVLRELLGRNCGSRRRGYWTVRLAQDLEHLGRKEESLLVCEAALDDESVRGGDRLAIQKRAVRLSRPPRRWKKPHYAEAVKFMGSCREVRITGRPLNSVVGQKSRFYGFDGSQCGVEELALQYYASEEGGKWKGTHSEGGIWLTFFGLLFWDILFLPVPDVFQNPFQRAPLDLRTEGFYSARQVAIDDRVRAIAEGEAQQLLCETWANNYGTWCSGVNWERHTLPELLTIALCVGASGMATICRLLADDRGGSAGGMPDLLLWREVKTCQVNGNKGLSRFQKGKAELPAGNLPCSLCGCDLAPPQTALLNSAKEAIVKREAKLSEVKGPRDKLSEHQQVWIGALKASGLEVEVLKVIESGENVS